LTLALQRADHHALCEVLQNEGIEAEYGQDGDDDGAVFDKVSILSQLGVVGQRRGVALNEDLTKDNLQGVHLTIVQIDHSFEVGVPLHQNVLQSKNGDGSFDQRNNDLEQNGEVACTVETGRFFKAGRHTLDSSTDNNKRHDVNCIGDDHNQTVVQQADLLDDHVGGDHTTVEEHGDGQEDHDVLFQNQALTGKDKAAHGAQDGGECTAECAVENGVGIAHQQGVVAENHLVTVKGKGMSFVKQGLPDKTGMLSHKGGIREGSEYNVKNGHQTYKCEAYEKYVVEYFEYPSCRSFYNK